MKIEYKQSFEIEGQEFKIKKKDKVEVATVPAFFCFIAYFIALIKDQKIKILEVNEAEFKDVDLKYAEAKLSDEDKEAMQAHIESVLGYEEESEESEEGSESDEESNSIPDGDLPVSDSEEVAQASSEVKAEDAEAKPSNEEIEFNELHEKAKRLNKLERKRYEELKAKLGKEG